MLEISNALESDNIKTHLDIFNKNSAVAELARFIVI